MSVQALAWALERAEGVPPHLVSLLIGLANHAGPQGTGAYPSIGLLSRYTRKGERQVKRDLTELLELQIVRVGDQRLVQHVRADRRPVVYDLAMTAPRGVVEDTSQDSRGDADDMSYMSQPDSHDMSYTTPRTPRGDIQGRHGVSPTTPEPSTKPSSGHLEGVTHHANGNRRPPDTCPEHRDDPNPPDCGRCRTARLKAERWEPPTPTPPPLRDSIDRMPPRDPDARRRAEAVSGNVVELHPAGTGGDAA